jgi:hypothetical protein
MAEVRLLAFARTAWEVSRAVLPVYRTCFSKQRFTQPQLLAILCLMRYEGWTFREAEVRLCAIEFLTASPPMRIGEPWSPSSR